MNDFTELAQTTLRAGYGSDAGSFLISVIFGLFIFLILIRFLLQIARADFYNPISQTIVKLTTPLLRPFRKVIPGFGGIDFASIVLLLLLTYVKLLLIGLLAGQSNNLLYLLALAFIDLINLTIWIYIVCIFILVIASWIAAGNYNPVLMAILQLTNPIMHPIRRIMPQTHGIDFSPLVAMVLLTLIQMALPYLAAGFRTLILG